MTPKAPKSLRNIASEARLRGVGGAYAVRLCRAPGKIRLDRER
jgi:hypothetical protein